MTMPKHNDTHFAPHQFDSPLNRRRNDEALIALGFDKGSAGCSSCQALSINGQPTHETGCPNQTHICKGCDDCTAAILAEDE